MVNVRAGQFSFIGLPLITILSCLSCPALSGQEVQPQTVCSIMGDLRKYANQVVTVVGEFESGEDLFFLYDGSCAKRFITDGLTWPAAFQLRQPGGPETPATLPFEADKTSLTAFAEALRGARGRNGGARGCLAVTGLVQVREKYEVSKLPDGRLRGRGFGHMDAYPAQLVIKSVTIKALEPYSGRSCTCCQQ